jgi:transcription antitermination factor NusG
MRIERERHMNQGIENHLVSNEKRWFAIYTKFKAEKYVVECLKKKGITAYLPLIKKSKRYTRKVKFYEVPLINCYAFVCIDNSEYVKVLETEYLLKFIKQGKNLISIPKKEIDLLERIVNSENLTMAQQISFVEGKLVEIISGQLTGLKGKLVARKNKNEFVVELLNMGIQLKLDINPAYLRPLKNAMSLV